MEQCPHCGERVHPDDAYCFECGTELGAPSDEGGDPTRERDADTARGQNVDPARTGRRGREPDTRGRPPEGEPDTGGRTPEEPARGRAPEGRPRREPARGRGREPARGQHPGEESTGSQVESLTTLWVAAVLSVVSLLENAAIVLFADDIVELVQQEDVGFGGNISADAIAFQGSLGLVIALAVAVVCAYYYRKGYVDRRFFWLLIVAGVAGFFLGGGLSVVLLIVVGAYGLLSVLGRDKSEGQPAGGVRRR